MATMAYDLHILPNMESTTAQYCADVNSMCVYAYCLTIMIW